MNKKRVVKLLFTAAFLGATGIFYSCSEQADTEVMVMTSQSPEPSSEFLNTPVMTDQVVSCTKVYVYICGQVNKPEVYELNSGARVRDVVKLAGGFTKNAALECVNLARIVVDGEQIYIPSIKEQEQGSYSITDKEVTTDKESGVKTNQNQSVNINLADMNELMTLPGIGEAKASAIIAYRNQHGAFRSPEELMNITGIKTGLYTKIKDYIKVN